MHRREIREELRARGDEEGKGDAAAQATLGDDEERQAAGAAAAALLIFVRAGRLGNVVDVVGAVGEGQLLGRLVVDLGQDEGGERGGLAGGGGDALSEDGGVVGDAGTGGEREVLEETMTKDRRRQKTTERTGSRLSMGVVTY